MKKFILIPLVVGVLMSIVIVDTMADPSDVFSINPMNNQQIRADIHSSYNHSNKSEITSPRNSKGGNSSALLSMSLIGLTLVGLAGFREGKNKRELDQLVAYDAKMRQPYELND
jgi:hypothetical protein